MKEIESPYTTQDDGLIPLAGVLLGAFQILRDLPNGNCIVAYPDHMAVDGVLPEIPQSVIDAMEGHNGV